MTDGSLATLAIASFLAAFVAVRVLLSRFGSFALDRPNERSLHEQPVPRTGGVAVLLGTAVALGFGAAGLWVPMAIALGLAVVSFADDVRGLPTWVRFIFHLLGAAILCWYYLSPMHLAALGLLTVAVVWLTNVYNFMDGSDGVAGGMSLIGFGAYAVAAQLAGHAPLAALCVALAAASAAFLLHNFHPARIFLGDVGSIPLGLLAGGLGIVGWRDDLWPLWFPVLVFGPFLGDATVTLLKRLLRGERVWRAHKDHYYQRMVRMGLGHRATAWISYAAMLACAVAALLGRREPAAAQAAAFAASALALGALAVWVDIRWARFLRQPSTLA
jgi:UDP-N-acetylmuramyl pentapeptide phosphotransferase/UDP-N-acetylglucosamine-1-phosphate transferase